MPVLATLITMKLFPRAEAIGFLNPDALRDRLGQELEDSPNREPALALVDELIELAAKYDEAAEATLEKYLTESVKWESSAAELIQLAEPLDRQRDVALRGIIRVRREMLDLLTEAEWETVFA